jgi:hypothetical protein
LKTKATLYHRLAITAALVLSSTTPAMAQEALTQVLAAGRINWTAATVRATGVATPAIDGRRASRQSPADVLDAARRSAEANLVATLNAICIGGDKRVADRTGQDAAFHEGLIALAQKAPVTRQAYLSDGTVEIELTMNMNGGFSQFVLPEEIRQVDSVTTIESADAPHGRVRGEPHTGLVIDARGIEARPCMVPVVVDENEAVVYGPAFVSREFAVSQQMSGFATSMAAARRDKRVGDRPLIVKAIRTGPGGDANLVIPSVAAARLRSSVVNLNFLKACRVSIVMDPQSHR